VRHLENAASKGVARAQPFLDEMKRLTDRRRALSSIETPKRFCAERPSSGSPESDSVSGGSEDAFHFSGMQDCSDVDAVYESAEASLPEFEAILRQVASKAGLDADAFVFRKGEPVYVEAGIPFRRVTVDFALKPRARCVEKLEREYSGDVSKLVDVLRGSVVVDNEDALQRVVDLFLNSGEAPTPDFFSEESVPEDTPPAAFAPVQASPKLRFRVVRFKNRFQTPTHSGYKDALLNIRLASGHVAEVQVHMVEFAQHKLASYASYAALRQWYHGRGADECALVCEALDAYGGARLDLLVQAVRLVKDESLVRSLEALFAMKLCDFEYAATLAGARVERAVAAGHAGAALRARLDVSRHLDAAGRPDDAGDVARDTHRAALELLGPSARETVEASTLCGQLLFRKGNFDEAEGFFSSALAERWAQFGPRHVATIRCALDVARNLVAQRRFGEGAEVARDAHSSALETLSLHHPTTLESMALLAAALGAVGEFSEAEALLKEAFLATKTVNGPQHAQTVSAAHTLLNLLSHLGRDDEIQRSYEAYVSPALGGDIETALHAYDKHPAAANAGFHRLGQDLRTAGLQPRPPPASGQPHRRPPAKRRPWRSTVVLTYAL